MSVLLPRASATSAENSTNNSLLPMTTNIMSTFSSTKLVASSSGDGSSGTSPATINVTWLATLLPGDDESTCSHLHIDYKLAPSIVCGVCFILGVVYCFFGYRLFKLSMFLAGFMFGSSVTYIICQEERLLNWQGKLGVALAAGFLCGIIAILVTYIGLFINGFHQGCLLVVIIVVTIDQFYFNNNKWLPIGLLFCLGLVFALLGLYIQRHSTLIGTAFIGSALIVVAIDYFIEKFIFVYYVWELLKAEESRRICWFSWLVVSLWPATFIAGFMLQWRVTAKGFNHLEVVQRRRERQVNLARMRDRDRRDNQHSRYRHLYRVRRWHGDVIAQDFVAQSPGKPGLRALDDQGPHEPDSVESTQTHIPTEASQTTVH